MADKFSENEIAALQQTTMAAREARFVELGRRGANANVKHPDRAEWERLRDLINRA